MCSSCKRRFTTYERVEEAVPSVVKKDGRREPFDRNKIIAGMKRACEKRPVSTETIEKVVANLEAMFAEQGDREIPSTAIGSAIMNELHKIDQVAYVRFASVYKEFRDVSEFMHEISALAKAKEKHR